MSLGTRLYYLNAVRVVAFFFIIIVPFSAEGLNHAENLLTGSVRPAFNCQY